MIQLTIIIVAAMGVLTSASPLNHNRKESSVMAFNKSTQKSTARKSYPFREMHGLTGNKVAGSAYQSWVAMRRRCEDKNFEKFPSYGGRGIKVCLGWHYYSKFFESMGDRPVGQTLDRIDNNGNYSCGSCEECIENGWPMNCRWNTPKGQKMNSSDVRMMTVNGETLCMTDMAKKHGIHIMTLYCRLKKGMSDEDAVFKPIGPSSRRYKKYGFPNPRNT